MNYANRIYLGTVLLERNRWVKGERHPSFAVSDWVRRIADAGFDGLELWENHAVRVEADERERLRASSAPVRLFNSYDRCEAQTVEARRRAADLSRFFGAEGMKFNFGRDPARHDEYAANAASWRKMLPAEFRFLCECHGGTTLEDPEAAARTFEQLGRDDYEIVVHGFGGGDDDLRRRFALHGRRITHIHAVVSSDGPPDEDAVRRRADLLAVLGFRGSYTLEFTEGVGAADECIETLFKNAARDLKVLRRCVEGAKA